MVKPVPLSLVTGTYRDLEDSLYKDLLDVRELNRDCVSGADRIKKKGDKYLVPLCKDSGAGPESELNRRAVFTPYVSRFVSGVVGALSKKAPAMKIDLKLFESWIEMDPKRFVAESLSNLLQTRTHAYVITTDTGTNDIKIVQYIAENILRFNDSYLLVREEQEFTPTIDQIKNGEYGDNTVIYREFIYNKETKTLSMNVYSDDLELISEFSGFVPVRPWVVVDTDFRDFPIISDMSQLNIHHYNVWALLQISTRFTSHPVYTMPVLSHSLPPDESSFKLFPGAVWMYPAESNGPQVLEYFGRARAASIEMLKLIQDAIVESGSRLVGTRGSGVQYESPGIYSLLRSIEISDLLVLVSVFERSMNDLLQKASTISTRVSSIKDPEFKVQKQSLIFSQIDYTGLNALSRLLTSGHIPSKVLFENMAASGFIDIDMTYDEFKKMVDVEKRSIVKQEGRREEAKAKAKAKANPVQSFTFNSEN